MSGYSFCKVSREDHILIVTLNRPDVRNSLRRPANLELDKVFDDFAADLELWVVIIFGAGDKRSLKNVSRNGRETS